MAHCEFGYADHKRIPNGTPVEYTAINGAKVKGVIVSQGDSMVPRFQDMRVTSKGNPAYPCGKVVNVSTTFVAIREK